MAYFYNGTGQILVSLFILRSATLSMRPHWRIYLQSGLLLENKLVVPYKWNHSTGCRKIRSGTTSLDGCKKSRRSGMQMTSSFAYSKRVKQKKPTTITNGLLENLKSSLHGLQESIPVHLIESLFCFKYLLQIFCNPELNRSVSKTERFSSQHWNLLKLCVCFNRRTFSVTYLPLHNFALGTILYPDFLYILGLLYALFSTVHLRKKENLRFSVCSLFSTTKKEIMLK